MINYTILTGKAINPEKRRLIKESRLKFMWYTPAGADSILFNENRQLKNGDFSSNSGKGKLIIPLDFNQKLSKIKLGRIIKLFRRLP